MQPRVMWWYGAYVVEPPGTRTRVSIDPKTFLPVRVDLLDAFGQSTVIGKLYQHGDVSLHKVPEKDWPRVAKRLDVTMVGKREKVTLKLWGMKDCKRKRCIKRRQFDFESLMAAFEPGRVVDLDAYVTTPQPPLPPLRPPTSHPESSE